jgi:hypothetical protein
VRNQRNSSENLRKTHGIMFIMGQTLQSKQIA